MRTIFLLCTFFALASSSHGEGRLVNVTPQTLAGWTLSGADKTALGSGTQLVLPPGAQLSREFRDGAVVLRLLIRPVFSEQPENWPVIGLGGAALVLIRENGRERMVLVSDETTALDLPWAIPADAGGKRAALEIFLASAPGSGVGVVAFQNQVQAFDLKPSAKPVEVWLSAGQFSAWPVDALQLLLLDANTDDSASTARTGVDSAQPPRATERLQAALSQLHATDPAGGSAVATVDGAGVAEKTIIPSTLEIFTPPSVRRIQVIETVRNAVAKTRAN